MIVYFLASGSKGNATLIVSEHANILVDFGMTKKRMVDLLAKVHVSLDHIDAVFFTHEHSDHGSGKEFIPIEKRYGSPRAFDVLPDHALAHGDIVQCHDITITVFPLSHDAKDPLGFIFDDGKHSLVYITDTGYISEKNMKLCYDKTYYLLESNHNVKMLLQTDRSQDLKVRILGDSGHLSNEDSAYYFSKMMGPSTKAVYLGHLSDEANTHDVALETYHRVLQKLRIKHDHIKIVATKQWDVVSTIDD
jgi:phosphoribosyl 1,2-cyclic phosphodiesterase